MNLNLLYFQNNLHYVHRTFQNANLKLEFDILCHLFYLVSLFRFSVLHTDLHFSL